MLIFGLQERNLPVIQKSITGTPLCHQLFFIHCLLLELQRAFGSFFGIGELVKKKIVSVPEIVERDCCRGED